MPSIYELLSQDHKKVKEALAKILDSTDRAEKTRESLFAQVKNDLELHTRFEEEFFYPQFREAKADREGRQEVEDAVEEHDEAKTMLSELDSMDKTSDEFAEKIGELSDALAHHISDEENKMFPQARKAFDDEAAKDLGERYQEMKRG